MSLQKSLTLRKPYRGNNFFEVYLFLLQKICEVDQLKINIASKEAGHLPCAEWVGVRNSYVYRASVPPSRLRHLFCVVALSR